jgi:uncharacterized protein (DUF433 family)
VSDWIVVDPERLGGKPCVRGTRLSVEFILERLAAGETQASLLAAFPQLTAEGMAAALAYAAERLREERVWDLKVPA